MESFYVSTTYASFFVVIARRNGKPVRSNFFDDIRFFAFKYIGVLLVTLVLRFPLFSLTVLPLRGLRVPSRAIFLAFIYLVVIVIASSPRKTGILVIL